MRSYSGLQLIVAGGMCLALAAVSSTSQSAVGNMNSNRTIPMNEMNFGMDLPLSNATGSVVTPTDAATLAALNNEWNIIRETYIRLGQQITEPEMNINSQGLLRDLTMRTQILKNQVPPAAAGLTGNDRTLIINEYQGELAALDDQFDRTLAALQASDSEAAWEEFSNIRLMHAERFGLE